MTAAVIAEFNTHAPGNGKDSACKRGSSNNNGSDNGSDSKVLLFISDIRSADWQTLGSHTAMDEEVQNDMSLQKEWHLALQPTASMLKFRLPWTGGCTRYLRGTVYFPVYGPLGTSETRLVVSDTVATPQEKEKEEKEMEEEVWYDHQTYWEQLFYFNSITR